MYKKKLPTGELHKGWRLWNREVLKIKQIFIVIWPELGIPRYNKKKSCSIIKTPNFTCNKFKNLRYFLHLNSNVDSYFFEPFKSFYKYRMWFIKELMGFRKQTQYSNMTMLFISSLLKTIQKNSLHLFNNSRFARFSSSQKKQLHFSGGFFVIIFQLLIYHFGFISGMFVVCATPHGYTSHDLEKMEKIGKTTKCGKWQFRKIETKGYFLRRRHPKKEEWETWNGEGIIYHSGGEPVINRLYL